jgi:cation diffusion facilitator family transporter
MGSQHALPLASADALRARQGVRAAVMGIVSNTALIALKGIIGVLGNSQALIADAVHSASDLLNSTLALGSFLYARRPPDWNHPYGHERAEAFASTIAAVLIGVAGVYVGRDSVVALMRHDVSAPALLTLIAAVIAILIKLGLTNYVGAIARRTKSKSILAEARDHLLDVVASGVVIVGIVLARLGFVAFDAIAGLFVSLFILVTAMSILREAARELMDTSLSPAQRHEIVRVAATVPGVRRVHGIAGRTIGHTILVELHVDVDPGASVADGARVVDDIKARVLAQVADVRTVVVELNTNLFEPEALTLMAPPDQA